MAILFDTGFLFALYNKGDLDHEIVKNLYSEILDGKHGVPYLFDYVFDELMTLTQNRTGGNRVAKEIGEDLLSDCKDFIKFSNVSTADFNKGWDLFRKQTGPKLLSFTDCIIISVSKNLNIKKVAGLDQHFKSFVTLLPIIKL